MALNPTNVTDIDNIFASLLQEFLAVRDRLLARQFQTAGDAIEIIADFRRRCMRSKVMTDEESEEYHLHMGIVLDTVEEIFPGWRGADSDD